MSSAAFCENANGLFAAWETNDQVYFAKIDPKTFKTSQPIPAPGAGQRRKHPVLAVNANGEVLLVWTEGTGWQKGGDLAWQVFDATGQPTAEKGRINGGIPVWSFAAVIARQDGGFAIIH